MNPEEHVKPVTITITVTETSSLGECMSPNIKVLLWIIGSLLVSLGLLGWFAWYMHKPGGYHDRHP